MRLIRRSCGLANEEVRSANEELQSTNEELSTTKEELQSANEELTTVNEELQNRNEQLNSANNDLNNLLTAVQYCHPHGDSTSACGYNSAAQQLLELAPIDVGQPGVTFAVLSKCPIWRGAFEAYSIR